MTIPRKGTRLITVDGNRYRYLIKVPPKNYCSPYPDEYMTLLLVQEAVSKGAGNILKVPTDLTITPKFVSEIIRSGIKNGWEPHKKGPPVYLKQP